MGMQKFRTTVLVHRYSLRKKEKLAVKINGKAQQNKYKEISKKPS